MFRLFATAVGDAVAIDVGHHHAFQDLDAEFLHQTLCFCRKVFRKSRQDARAAFHQHDLSFLRPDVTEVVAERFARDFGQRSGKLHARRAPADDDERAPSPRLLVIRGPLGAFESIKDFVADGGGLFDALQTGRPFAPRIVPVVGGLRAGGDDQRVVFKFGAVAQDHAPGAGIHVHGFAQQDARVLLPAQHAAQRRGNLARRERAGGHLIEQRLEEMEIAPVNQRHVHLRALQLLRRAQAAKTTAQNHHSMARCHLALRKIPPNFALAIAKDSYDLHSSSRVRPIISFRTAQPCLSRISSHAG